MLRRSTEARLSEGELADALHPGLAGWFIGRFGRFAPAQRLGVPEILAGHSTLVSSPTGSGKTLAAFLGVFDFLAKARDAGRSPEGIVAIYISPLRALAYDLQKNLQQPLAELGWDWLRVAARTGDTTPKERAAQKRRPPHILVTTPESLTLLLSQPSWLAALRSCPVPHHRRASRPGREQAGRASHGVGRAAAGGMRRPAHPGGAFRDGGARWKPWPSSWSGRAATAAWSTSTQRKAARIEVFSPLRENAYPPAGYTGRQVLGELAELLRGKTTTLIFTNTRSGAETIGVRLKELLPELSAQVEVHHASLDRSVRLEVEDRLRKGELRAVVCSTSLEMGIDIGSIDLVVMVSAPKGVSRALQRLGRSGHSMGATSHGLLVASNINDLAECAATARMMELRRLEPVRIHHNPLDVLAQTLVGLAVFASMTPEEALALVRRSYPFRGLSPELFQRVLRYLEGGGVSLERNYRAMFGKVKLDEGGNLALYASSGGGAQPLPEHRDHHLGEHGPRPAGTALRRPGRGILHEADEPRGRLRPGRPVLAVGGDLHADGQGDRGGRGAPHHTAVVCQQDAAGPRAWRRRWSRLRTGMAVHRDAAWLEREYGLSRDNADALAAHFALQAEISAIPTEDFFPGRGSSGSRASPIIFSIPSSAARPTTPCPGSSPRE